MTKAQVNQIKNLQVANKELLKSKEKLIEDQIEVLKEFRRSESYNLFDEQEVLDLCDYWIKENEYRDVEPPDDSLAAYYNGIAQGVRFVRHLLMRMGD